MDRRQFLQATSVGAVGLGLPAAAWFTDSDPSLQRLAEPELLYILGDPERVREIGTVYRMSVPHEGDAEALRDAILAGSEASGRVPEFTTSAHLRKQVSSDFAADRTVVINGWVLSVTEARQCALFSLLYS
ncbi:MAG TPA: twin-arginine translocation signal domain-containing protein [Rhodothermales bacterium]|nr:twin-arginine translocation signal domain-containing protein [Rhodothermales bacterium]